MRVYLVTWHFKYIRNPDIEYDFDDLEDNFIYKKFNVALFYSVDEACRISELLNKKLDSERNNESFSCQEINDLFNQFYIRDFANKIVSREYFHEVVIEDYFYYEEMILFDAPNVPFQADPC